MIIVVVGPTGVGKSKMGIELAKIYNGEIINADSMQIYKGLDIGTAKVTKAEMQHIPHHLLSIKEIEENYTVFDYQRDARKKIDEVKSRGHIPIFVGGTGYYIKAAFYDYKFEEEKENLKERYENYTNEELIKKIEEYECGFAYDDKNRSRLIRLLSKLDNGWTPEEHDFILQYDDVLFIGLTTNREILYQRINSRFDDMLIPLIDEVKPYAINNVRTKALMTGIGYKEFYPFFNNEKSLVDVVLECKKNSRNYAKRQYTWFNNQMDVKWFDVNFDNFTDTVNAVCSYIENNK